MSRVEDFNHDYENFDDVDTLVSIKEQIKSQVSDYNITWYERIELYRKIQTINERISELENTPIK